MNQQRTTSPHLRPSLDGSADRLAARPALVHPAFRRLPPPLIVLGMHRSGTSVVAGILARLGVYMGPEAREELREPASPGFEERFERGYAESQDFRLLNERVLAYADATWDRIEPFLARREEPALTLRCVARMQAATFGRLRTGYLGNARGPWGWKDPRNSLTLPYWLRLFPEARLLYVSRSADAAADSLHRRALQWSAATPPQPDGSSRLRFALRHPLAAAGILARRAGLTRAPVALPDPCLDPALCRALGDRYREECLRFRNHPAGCLTVKYEELLDDPRAVTRALAEFAGVAATTSGLQEAAALVRQPAASTRGR